MYVIHGFKEEWHAEFRCELYSYMFCVASYSKVQWCGTAELYLRVWRAGWLSMVQSSPWTGSRGPYRVGDFPPKWAGFQHTWNEIKVREKMMPVSTRLGRQIQAGAPPFSERNTVNRWGFYWWKWLRTPNVALCSESLGHFFIDVSSMEPVTLFVWGHWPLPVHGESGDVMLEPGKMSNSIICYI